MTEVDWLTGTDWTTHVRFATECLSPRRQRLLAVGFCRAVSHLFDHPELISALAVVEQFADELASSEELEAARQQCRVLAQQAHEAYARQVDGGTHGNAGAVRADLAWAVSYAAICHSLPVDAVEGVGKHAASAAVQARTHAMLLSLAPLASFEMAIDEQAIIMRGVVWEVMGNPFRPVKFSPAWRTDTAVSLAKQMYESREFSAMPILADALQDAGCDNDDVLSHCRGKEPHVRGCWVVDGVLGKK